MPSPPQRPLPGPFNPPSITPYPSKSRPSRVSIRSLRTCRLSRGYNGVIGKGDCIQSRKECCIALGVSYVCAPAFDRTRSEQASLCSVEPLPIVWSVYWVFFGFFSLNDGRGGISRHEIIGPTSASKLYCGSSWCPVMGVNVSRVCVGGYVSDFQ